MEGRLTVDIFVTNKNLIKYKLLILKRKAINAAGTNEKIPKLK